MATPVSTRNQGALESGSAPLGSLGPQVIAARYQVKGLIGSGGMACVYRCRDRFGCGDVAVKRLLVDATDSTIVRECFQAETLALSVLDHDNVVTLRDFGEDADGTPFLVMDLVDGVALNRLPVVDLGYPLLWSIVDQLLAALSHTHQRGVVHGDLTPANVLVDEGSHGARVRLVDFGLCWHFGGSLDPCGEVLGPLSGPPAGCGTLGYMAPEQLRGERGAIGPQTDLYALGAIVYRLVSGHRPRTSGPRSMRCLLPLEQPERPQPIRSDIPEAVVDFAMELLQNEPLRRNGSSEKVRDAWGELRPADPCPHLSCGYLSSPGAHTPSETTTRVDRPQKDMMFPTIAALAGW